MSAATVNSSDSGSASDSEDEVLNVTLLQSDEPDSDMDVDLDMDMEIPGLRFSDAGRNTIGRPTSSPGRRHASVVAL